MVALKGGGGGWSWDGGVAIKATSANWHFWMSAFAQPLGRKLHALFCRWLENMILGGENGLCQEACSLVIEPAP